MKNLNVRSDLRRFAGAIIIAMLILAIVPVPPARAATTWTVSTTDDQNGDCDEGTGCSLREAITAALSGDTINFASALTGGTIRLTNGTGLEINKNLTIVGLGSSNLTISGDTTTPSDDTADVQVLFIYPTWTVNISGLTITKGKGGYGGGIQNRGTLILNDVVVSDCVADTSFGYSNYGGGIYSYSALTMTNSSVVNNEADNGGGGIFLTSEATATLTNVLIDGNHTTNTFGSGGGIYIQNTATLNNVTITNNSTGVNGGGIYGDSSASINVTITNSLIAGNSSGGQGGGMYLSTATFNLTNVTVSGNQATSASAGAGAGIGFYSGILNANNMTIYNNTAFDTSTGGGGLFVGSGTANVTNTILAGNTAPGITPQDCAGTLTSGNHNLIQNVTGCNISATTDNIIGSSPNLEALAENGGPTKTHKLLSGSPAIGAGNNASCASTDQRGVKRPQGAVCDIGAYEVSLNQLIAFKSIGAQDGWILESGEKTSKGGSMNSTSTVIRLGDNAAKKQYRGILSFKTSSLSGKTIVGVTLQVKKQGITGGGNPVTTFKGFMVDVKKGYIGTSASLQTTDFQTAASKTYGPFKTVISAGNWYNIDLTSGKNYINKVSTTASGLTQIRLRFYLDDNNNTTANYLGLYSGNTTTVANCPQLVIEYYVP